MSPVVNVFCPCNKNYTIQHLPEDRRYPALVPGTVNLDGIAQLFYSENPDLDNIVVNTYGGWHQTFPNPYHLTVKIDYTDNQGNPQNTDKKHYSLDMYGRWYIQHMGAGNKKKIKKKSKKSKKIKKI